MKSGGAELKNKGVEFSSSYGAGVSLWGWLGSRSDLANLIKKLSD
jgi:hypothetical protein